MCGIIAYIGKREAKELLLEGLHRLEYRGYDSAGLTLFQKGKLYTVKAVGRVVALESKMANVRSRANIGIAHTRWATHGKPSERNAHPHRDHEDSIRIVHNGIIENYQELKQELEKKGHHFFSETDSEVIAHLLEELRKTFSLEDAFVRTLKRLKGTYGLVVIVKDTEGLLAARMGSPLVIGVGQDEHFIASDVSAILASTRKVVYLEDGEWAFVTRDGYRVKRGVRLSTKEPVEIDWKAEVVKKGGFPHFMLKEIYEQSESVENAFRGRLDFERGTVILGGLREANSILQKMKRLVIISCGTSYYAGLFGKYILEEYTNLPVEVEFASEFRYRKPSLDTKTAVLVISQSGETADTLAALREAKEKRVVTLGIVNVVGSTIARETLAGIYNHAGSEVSVASTKAFTSQLTILVLLTLFFGRQRQLSLMTGRRILRELRQLPKKIQQVFKCDSVMRRFAKKYNKIETILYLGRKYQYPVALEGALKIKEIAYVNAQGYPTGEMKHGPIALIDSKTLVVLLAPKDSVYEKNISGLQEIRARGGQVVVITTEDNTALDQERGIGVVKVPKTLEMLLPILTIIPLQLFAYHMSVVRGFDVDKPRNLAKSVTVE